MILKFNEPDLAKITQCTPDFFGYNVLQSSLWIVNWYMDRYTNFFDKYL